MSRSCWSIWLLFVLAGACGDKGSPSDPAPDAGEESSGDGGDSMAADAGDGDDRESDAGPDAGRDDGNDQTDGGKDQTDGGNDQTDGGNDKIDGGNDDTDAGPDAGDATDGGTDGDAGTDGGAGSLCDPIAQSGCASGQKCTAVEQRPACRPNGTLNEGDACTRSNDSDNCVAGTVCYDEVCTRICDTNMRDCACTGVATFDYMNVGLCQTACSPLQDDCSDSEDACYTTWSGFGVCTAQGTLAHGADCTYLNECAPGNDCIGFYEGEGSPECAQRCDSSGDNTCPSGHACADLNALHETMDFDTNLGTCVDCARATMDVPGCP